MIFRLFDDFFMNPAVSEGVLRYVAMDVGAGGALTSSVHLEWPKTIGSGVFWVRTAAFSTFW